MSNIRLTSGTDGEFVEITVCNETPTEDLFEVFRRFMLAIGRHVPGTEVTYLDDTDVVLTRAEYDELECKAEMAEAELAALHSIILGKDHVDHNEPQLHAYIDEQEEIHND